MGLLVPHYNTGRHINIREAVKKNNFRRKGHCQFLQNLADPPPLPRKGHPIFEENLETWQNEPQDNMLHPDDTRIDKRRLLQSFLGFQIGFYWTTGGPEQGQGGKKIVGTFKVINSAKC